MAERRGEGGPDPEKSVSYVSYENWNWIVAAGMYVDEFGGGEREGERFVMAASLLSASRSSSRSTCSRSGSSPSR